MLRRALVVVVALTALVAFAKDKRVEMLAALNALMNGSMSATQVSNKISFLGAEREATELIIRRFPEAPTTAARSLYLEVLVQVATPHPDLVGLAASSIQSDEITTRLNGIRLMARSRVPAAVTVLAPLLGDKALGVRREAARALVALKNPRPAGQLLTAAKTEDDPETRALMIVGVGRLGDVKQAKGLESLLESSSESTRLAATQALCLLGNKKGFEVAKAQLTSKEKYERVQGVMLFEGAPSSLAAPMLTPMLADPEVAVRARAARILAQGGDGKMIEWLVLESFKSPTDDKLVYETEIEQLRITDEARADILRKAGLKK